MLPHPACRRVLVLVDVKVFDQSALFAYAEYYSK